MSSILSIENLKYKDILNGVSFDLEENTFNILMGENGCGKTTLVKCIFGLLKFDGTVIVNHNIMCDSNINELRRDIGVLTDIDILLPGTVLYNITYPLLNLNYSEEEAKKRAYEISKKIGLNGLLLKNVEDLSPVERKIVSFCVSIVHGPRLIIIDESFDELDALNRKKILGYLKKLSNSTVLFVSNREKDISLADNLIIMKDGKISISGKTLELLKSSKTFSKNNIEIPFLVDLSEKLQSYGVIKELILDVDDMVNEIWK